MSSGEIYSVRIVVADHYMCRPVPGLDPCYSEFRAYEIKWVPVIRIFGSDRSGEKTCLHVHGVFPYFYVPYENADLGSIDKTIYQIASSVDKALNISLGQTNSRQQHVFKIQLVKGRPFYGFHCKEHQFLKIYLYNPRFVRRVANLFQNGAVLGKIFQPHESHVPYILQFFIDYNLYGMSFLHVPCEVLKYRIRENADMPSIYNSNQLVDNVPRISTSKHEVDVAASFILNRFQILSCTSTHTNPGIESIWQDEKSRRQKLLQNGEEVPALEIPFSQERIGIEPTESDVFYLTALKKKLLLTEEALNQTISSGDVSQTGRKSKFNLKKLLMNSIYPQECSQEENLMNASVIQNHFSNRSLLHPSILRLRSDSPFSESSTDDSLVDEELVMVLSQNKLDQTLQSQDLDVLEIMKQLEEGDKGDEEILDLMQILEEGEQQIDLDSSLAPLSQKPKLSAAFKENDDLNKTLGEIIEASDEDDDSHDFTLLVDDVDEVLEKLSQSNVKSQPDKIPQLDGADDLRTPKKLARQPIDKTLSIKNPRTPSKRHRYNELQISTTKSPRRNINNNGEISDNEEIITDSVIDIKNQEECKTSIQDKITAQQPRRRSKRLKKIDIEGEDGAINQTYITCEFRNPRNIEERKLRVYNVNASPTRKCKVKIKRLTPEKIQFALNKSSPSLKLPKKRCRSPSDVAREYDRRNNFFPEPGPSHINYYERIDVPNPEIPIRISPSKVNEVPVIEINDSGSEEEEDLNIRSFYEKSFLVDSPSMFSDSSPPSSREILERRKSCDSKSELIITPKRKSELIITPKQLPPTFEDVANNLTKYNIPEVKYIKPFYSNNADITQKKEVGSTVLRIPGKSLNDCEEFESVLTGLGGIYARRRKMLADMHCSLVNQFKTNNEIKEYLCNEQKVVISTRDLPPTKHEAKVWLKARELLQNQEKVVVEEDSPIKVRREKPKLILMNDPCSNEDLDSSQKSLSLTPLTPLTNGGNKMNGNSVPDSDTGRSNSSNKNQRIIRSRARVSLTAKLNQVAVNGKPDKSIISIDGTSNNKLRCIADEKIMDNATVRRSISSTQSNESVTSEMVKAVLERSSFRKNLNMEGGNSSQEGSFGITGVTLDNTFGFKVNLENLQNAKADIEFDYLSIMSLEVYVSTREDLKPNPEYDSIVGLFYSIINNVPENYTIPNKFSGCVLVVEGKDKFGSYGIDERITKVDTEKELLVKLLELVHYWDPDIFAGYEIEMSSWGYVIERARYLNMAFMSLLSRIPSQKVRDATGDEEKDQFTDLDVELKLCGRILLDVWRLMRSEIALTSYSFENVMYHILHRRCPKHTHKDLTKWFGFVPTRWIVLEYYFERVNGTLELLDQLDLIGRTGEMAKLIGIQFYEVLSRGSQFRVESMMLRIGKPKNLVPLSPSVQQRAHMRAPEYLPLILEPQSRMYTDPLIVLDFQSLYPSMIIAYNYCFSTCLGRVEHLGQKHPFEFGASQLRVSRSMLKRLIERDEVTVSPCGAVFVKSKVRKGILPQMLQEILDTRLMVKQSMKIHKSNSILQRVLHSRQLGLKLMANVTYGYTAANFSGRMPCVEVGDSVVSKGRETLERAIKMVEANKNWRAQVVYGDTDSLFVLCPGRSRTDAFKIGEEIVETVTNDNPQPVKLKLEKIYQPCILQTKKRYVGYMYESAEQKEPTYEAKGIETVRRDGCPAVAKMLEKCLRILFETKDVSKIKSYVCRQFTKLLSGRANVQDLIFAKEFRGRNGYKPGACVPALELTRKWLQSDPRNEPRRGERVPFVIINGPPGVPLIRLVRSPHEFLADEGMKINAIYYITKAIIPPLNRCLLLIGADVNEWFADLPRKNFFIPKLAAAREVISNNNCTKKSTISQYFSSTNCVIDCGRQTKSGICGECKRNSQKCTAILSKKIMKLDRGYFMTKMICESCCSRKINVKCCSLDCPVLYVLEVKRREQKQTEYFRNLIEENF